MVYDRRISVDFSADYIHISPRIVCGSFCRLYADLSTICLRKKAANSHTFCIELSARIQQICLQKICGKCGLIRRKSADFPLTFVMGQRSSAVVCTTILLSVLPCYFFLVCTTFSKLTYDTIRIR